jgi:HptB-dependent secretion and biofilm anti anti-sigma factor
MGGSVTSKVSDEEVVISIDGAFSFEVHNQFLAAYTMDEEVIAGKNFVVDLAKTNFCDSSALGMLLILREKAAETESSIKIINTTPEIRKILETARFHTLFNIS